MYTVIDMKKDPRREHFEHFTSLDVPFAGVTVKVDVTKLVRFCKERHCSFYAAMTRIAILAGNRVPEFRRRIVGSEVREYEECSASITELGPFDAYYYCTLSAKESWEAFIPYAEKTRAERRTRPGLFEEDDETDQFFITCTPDLHFEQIINPLKNNVSNPMIGWGRYEEDWKGRLMMPLSVLVHHALADGVHIARFYKNVEEELNKL